jgi:hypothetical protein
MGKLRFAATFVLLVLTAQVLYSQSASIFGSDDIGGIDNATLIIIASCVAILL